jgi:hypothetical protein
MQLLFSSLLGAVLGFAFVKLLRSRARRASNRREVAARLERVTS